MSLYTYGAGSGGIMTAPTNPIDWIGYLEGRLGMQQARIRHYGRYYDSEDRPLRFAQIKFAEEYGGMFQGWQDNFCTLVVDAVSERLKIEGFRLLDDDTSDRDAWEIWQRNFLDSDSNSTHIDALVNGAAFLTVWSDQEHDGEPLIVPESAEDVVVQYKPGSRRELSAALKKYSDDWGTEYVTLWTPEYVYTAVRGADNRDWSTPEEEANPLGVVPVIPLTNRTRLKPDPHSEIGPIIPLQDAIDKIAADAIVASEFAAVPMRWISGMEVEEDSEGKPVSPIRLAINRILTAEDPTTKFGQFEAADLKNYVNLIDMFVQHISTISRVPPHMFLINGGQAPSGESIQSSEAGLVAKARERQLHFGESWERAMRLAFKVKGDDAKAEAWQAEVIWRDPEFRSEGVTVDAAVKKVTAGIIPRKQAAEDLNYTPQQIERFESMIEEDQAKAIEQQRAMAEITGAEGGSAPAGNGTKAPADTKSASNRGNQNRKAADK